MMVTDYGDIKEGARLYSKSEDYYGSVIIRNGVLQTDCMGFGWEPISGLDLDDIIIVQET